MLVLNENTKVESVSTLKGFLYLSKLDKAFKNVSPFLNVKHYDYEMSHSKTT